jgi:hypothetical protein
MNYNGEEIITTSYDKVGDFKDGLPKVISNGKYGHINKVREIVIPITFDSAAAYSEGMASVTLNDYYYFLDGNGNEKLALALDNISVPDRIIVKVNQNQMLYSNRVLGLVSK